MRTQSTTPVPRSKPATLRTALLKNFSTAITAAGQGHQIYRGKDAATKRWYIVQPGKSPARKSANTNEVYMALFQLFSSWKKYPPRAKSIICSTAKYQAHVFGDIHLVLPKNGARIGICSAGDFWDSFPYLNYRWDVDSMDSFNYIVRDIILAVNGLDPDEGNFYNTDWVTQQLKKMDRSPNDKAALKALQPKNRLSMDHNVKAREDIIKHKKDSWLEYFEEILHPDENNFSLLTIEDFTNTTDHSYEDKEVWTDEVSLLYNTGEENTEKAGEIISSMIKKRGW